MMVRLNRLPITTGFMWKKGASSALIVTCIEVCRDCHDEVTGESEAELILVNYLNENRRLPWVQVYTVPDHVYFSHRRHVKLGELACDICHGEVAKLTTPFTEPHVKITMEWCINCHEASGVSNDCYACHR
jgi:hypothetical protein